MRIAIATTLLLSLVSLGCAGVAPYQRGRLAKIEQCQERQAAARAYEAHMWMVREGAVGGYGRPGGGCGCN